MVRSRALFLFASGVEVGSSRLRAPAAVSTISQAPVEDRCSALARDAEADFDVGLVAFSAALCSVWRLFAAARASASWKDMPGGMGPPGGRLG